MSIFPNHPMLTQRHRAAFRIEHPRRSIVWIDIHADSPQAVLHEPRPDTAQQLRGDSKPAMSFLDIDPFELSVASEPARQVFSICPWPKDAVSSLPKTAMIMLSLGETDAFRVASDDAIRIAGDLMEPLDCWPPRYRVAAFPEGEQLAALRAAALA